MCISCSGMHASISETVVAVCHHLQQMSRWHKPVRQTGGGRLAALCYATGSALGTTLAQFSYDTTPSAAILVEQPLPPYVTVLWPHLSNDCRPLWIPPIQSTYWPAGSTPMDMSSSNNGSARTVDWERRETLREESRWRRREVQGERMRPSRAPPARSGGE